MQFHAAEKHEHQFLFVNPCKIMCHLLIIIKIILNERIIGIELRYNNQLLVYIFCVYMPSDYDIVLDHKTLCDIQSIFSHYYYIGTF